MSKKKHVPVSEPAVLQRINRTLAKELQTLKVTRGERARIEVGDYYVLDHNRNFIVATHVDVEGMACELGVLREYEQLMA